MVEAIIKIYSDKKVIPGVMMSEEDDECFNTSMDMQSFISVRNL